MGSSCKPSSKEKVIYLDGREIKKIWRKDEFFHYIPKGGKGEPVDINEIDDPATIKALYLDKNKLRKVGKDDNFFSDFRNLLRIDLRNNRMSVFPSSLLALDCTQTAHLCSLTALNLSRNYIEKLPDEINHLYTLETLRLRENKIETLPKLHNLTRLRILDLHHNPLSKIEGHSDHLLHLENLEELDVSSSLLKELPMLLDTDDAGKFKGSRKLKKLDCGHTQLNIFPAWLKYMKSLERMVFSYTYVDYIPQFFLTWKQGQIEVKKLKSQEVYMHESVMNRFQKEVDVNVNPVLQEHLKWCEKQYYKGGIIMSDVYRKLDCQEGIIHFAKRNQRLEREIEDTRDALEKQSRKLDEISEQLKKESSELRNVQSLLSNVRKQKDDLKQQQEKSNQELEKMKNERTQQCRQIYLKKQDNNKQRRKITVLKERLSDFQINLDCKEELLNDQILMCKRLREENERLSKENDRINAQNLEISERNQVLLKSNSDLCREHNSQIDQLDARRSEDISQKLSALENQLLEVQKQQRTGNSDSHMTYNIGQVVVDQSVKRGHNIVMNIEEEDVEDALEDLQKLEAVKSIFQ